jgi:seryl-tRNA synthetase
VVAQRLRGLKYELRLPAEDGRTVAAASFNVHGTTFGEPYEITLPTGETAHSACVGFGLERLAFALYCQHGIHKDAWPDTVRKALNR